MPAPPRRHFLTIASIVVLIVLAAIAWGISQISDEGIKLSLKDRKLLIAEFALFANELSRPFTGLSANSNLEKIDEAVANIETFFAQYPDAAGMGSRLRLHQGLRYLHHGQLSLAQYAFSDVERYELHSAIEHGLLEVSPLLIWWNQTASRSPALFLTNEKTKAEEAMDTLLFHSKRSFEPELRDYFLELRAWIGLKLSLSTPDPIASVNTLQNAINPWAETFSPAELSLLVSSDFKDVEPFDFSTRRVLRARTFLVTLSQQTAGRSNAAFSLNQPAFQQYYESLKH